jgi:hypothetical protein
MTTKVMIIIGFKDWSEYFGKSIFSSFDLSLSPHGPQSKTQIKL